MQAKPDDTQRGSYTVSIILLLRRLRQSQRVLNTKLGCNTELEAKPRQGYEDLTQNKKVKEAQWLKKKMLA